MPERELTGLTLSVLPVNTGGAKFDLTLSLAEGGGRITGTLEYNTDLFDSTTIKRMLAHYRNVLEEVVKHPDEQVGVIDLMTDAERHQLVVERNATAAHYPETAIPQMFEAQVERSPHALAASYGNEQLSYQDLNARANQLAHHLRGLGIRRDAVVGICIERGIEMMVGVLAVLKAGGAYVPLDPGYPSERLAYMLEDSNAPVLLTSSQLAESLPTSSAKVVCLDTDWNVIAQQSDENLSVATDGENLTYVIYTSGSTGRPKGVAMRQRALANMVLWQVSNFASRPDARTAQFASLSFDVSFQEIFSTWLSGGTLIIVPEDARRDALALSQLLAREEVERLFLPFVALQQIAEASKESYPQSLREIITAGEALKITPAIAGLLKALPECVLQNHYGPTEAHVVTWFSLTGSPEAWPALPPIGQPITNLQIYILDSLSQPVPVGIPGELYIGGAGLARGYFNDAERTAEKFIPNPFSKDVGARLYKTGDSARYLSDGNIEFIGRTDHQVKIRGFRVEPGEIEAELTRHAAVSDAAVVAREDSRGNKRLVGYVVASDQNGVTINDLRSHLKAKLPEYMVPCFVMMDELPMTPSGKLDRRSLHRPSELTRRQLGRR